MIPYTNFEVEEGLKKNRDEINPFRFGIWSVINSKISSPGHDSYWSVIKNTAIDFSSQNWSNIRNSIIDSNLQDLIVTRPETIGEMMERWDETLEDSAKSIFDDLCSEYLAATGNGTNKMEIAEKKIKKYQESKIEIASTAKNFREGYRNKGYRWFEEGRNFSIKDFVLYNPETTSCEVYTGRDNLDTKTAYLESMVENAPNQELHFHLSCEGYAHAKFVHFLKNISEGDIGFDSSIDFIEPALQNRFIQIEERTKNEFKESNIRCAAWCELLFTKKYFVEKKNRIKACNDFAKRRYGKDVENSLLKTKEEERNKHINNTVKDKKPLKNYFT